MTLPQTLPNVAAKVAAAMFRPLTSNVATRPPHSRSEWARAAMSARPRQAILGDKVWGW